MISFLIFLISSAFATACYVRGKHTAACLKDYPFTVLQQWARSVDQDLLTKGLGAAALCLGLPICVSLSRPSDVSVSESSLRVPASHRPREKAHFRDPLKIGTKLVQTGLKKSQITSYSIYASDGFFFKQLSFSQNALTQPVSFFNFVANCVFYWTKQNFLKFAGFLLSDGFTLCAVSIWRWMSQLTGAPEWLEWQILIPANRSHQTFESNYVKRSF